MRSNGVRVSATTFARIRTGDAARTRQDWQAAAGAYRAALAREPQLSHVWIQLGHMEKEAGTIDRAEAAYREAAQQSANDPEPLLHLGHMAKVWRLPAEAAGHFVAALQRDVGNMEATAELVRLLPDRDNVDPALWSAILEVLGVDPAEQIADEARLLSGAMLFDVTDLLAFFGQRRLPTGIQRVQIEVALACLEDASDVRSAFCFYASARRGWIRLPDELLEEVCRLARLSDDAEDPVWKERLDRLYRRIAAARTIAFPAGAVLVNLGTSWADRNYLLDVRIARARVGLVYAALVFDLIPFIGPEWFIGSLVRDYRAWFASLVHSVDGCLAISQATCGDLLRIAAREGAPMPDDAVAVVRLDGDFRQPAAPVDAVRAYGLAPGDYVLLVSTLEPRKNHLGAFRAWLMLADAIGEAAMPRLVCVGGRGWLNDELHAMLRDRPVLGRMVVILHGIPDDTLAALYDHCLFALYPSFYEGWGLPVSEALSWGKVSAISRTSSLPEAGGAYARYFDPYDVADIAATVRVLLDDDTRTAAETIIRQQYRPRGWHDIARDVVARARMVASRSTETLPCLAGAGTWTLASFQVAGSDTGTPALPGEALRHGGAWQTPGADGCRIRGDDAALWFRWAGGAGMMLDIGFAADDRAGEVTIGFPGENRNLRIARAEPLVVSAPLPATPATLWVPILPLAGDVVVASVSISPAMDV